MWKVPTPLTTADGTAFFKDDGVENTNIGVTAAPGNGCYRYRGHY